ncbi:NINE protein [Campylobacter sp. 9BO]|uniref:NINE protein n=1 Tax=Campylobacter sp. 9BO TaxID=3424759 RepID=UPI003D3343B3
MNNIFIAYALWFFLGWLGAHRLYLGRFISGFAQMALFFLGSTTYWFFFIGFIPWVIWGIWWLLDVFATGRMVDENLLKQNMKNELKNKSLADDLRVLYEKFERGEITKAEFEARKEILFR